MSLPCPIPAQGTAAPVAAAPAAFPATCAQQRIWTSEQAQPGRAVHNVPLALSFDGPLDTPVLEQALNDVVSRHEILRTRFDLEGSLPVQVIAPTLHVPLPVIDLRLLPPAAREAQAFLLAREEASRPFDLRRVPLLRAQLYVLDETHRIFVLTVHQIMFDGRSRVILLRELSAAYEARRQGRSPRLPEMRAQYRDHARLQIERLPALEADLAWWQERLASLPAPLPLPADKTRPALPTGQGRVETLPLPSALPLDSLAHDENVTVSVVLLAAFEALLQRYTGRTDIVVATSSPGRHRAETENLIGLFRNTLVLRTDLSGDPSFRALLGRVRATYSDALSHSEAPFEKISARLGANAAAARPPGCQVFFAHDRRPLDTVNWPGLRVTQLELDAGAAKHDLALHIVESPLGFTARAEYDCDLFSAATIQRMLAHYGVLLRGAIGSPNRAISSLPLVTEAERRLLLGAWTESRAPFPRDATVHSLISGQAARAPANAAVAAGDKRITFRELDERSNQLARHLQSLGVAPGVLVGLLLERNLDLPIAALAVIKAGGAFTALDSAATAPRAGAALGAVICHASLRALAPQDARATLVLDEQVALISRLESTPPPSPAGPDDVACVVTTAGVTGAARGVELTHRALVNALHSLGRMPGVTADDVLLSVAPTASGAAAIELFLPLVSGARLVLAPANAASEPARLDRLLVQGGATIMHATPTQWQQLLAAGWSGRKTLRILCGGERLTRELADRLVPRCRELWHVYGTAETAVWTTVARISLTTPLVLGRPVGNAQIHLLDRHLQPVPVGLVAEIHVGGESLALGYRGDTETTAARFVPDPFRREPGTRLFATGDLGRRLAGGEIEFVGRISSATPTESHADQGAAPAKGDSPLPRRRSRNTAKNAPTL